MKVLFTGGSSFSGYWFVRALAEAGAEVTATFTRGDQDYEGTRAERVRQVAGYCQPVFGCSFGTDVFMDLLRSESDWDLICHHAADVTDYKSASFDVFSAVENNCRNIAGVLDEFVAHGGSRVLLTGSVFEQDEGRGDADLEAFSPYGLSKGLTAQVFRYYTRARGLHLGKFVIPNPFGPMEEPRFTTYLARTWLGGKLRRGQYARLRSRQYPRDVAGGRVLAICGPVGAHARVFQSQSERFRREPGRLCRALCTSAARPPRPAM